jgi:hypothetical protein
MTAGGVMAAIGATALAVATVTVNSPGDAPALLAIGAGLFGAGLLQVPAWARRRGEQFERIARRLRDAIRSQ